MTVANSETSRSSTLPRLPEELVASTAFLLKRLGLVAKDQAMEAYNRSGLHPYDHAQLVGLLDELEERGLVERRRDPADRRRHIVRLTPDGKRALAKLRALAGRLENEFLSALDDGERAQLHALLLRLAHQHLPHCAPNVQAPSAKRSSGAARGG